MRSSIRALWNLICPPIPATIADAMAVQSASRMQRHCRLLFLILFLSTPQALLLQNPAAPWWVRFGIPFTTGTFFLVGFLALIKDRNSGANAQVARRFITEATWTSTLLAIPCSIWTVVNWSSGTPAEGLVYPLIMVMGSMATAYCLSSIRRAAVANIAVGIIPITGVMLASGDRMSVVAALCIWCAVGFQLRMIFEQHGQFVTLLQLQHDVQRQAATDPLTGLANRRELADRLDAQMLTNCTDAPAPFALAILDLDGFKIVNDSYGHRVGDELLQSVAARLQSACGSNALAARIGGDEFAILFAPDEPRQPRQQINQILASLVVPHRVAGHVLHIGASTGMAHWPDDGATAAQLFDAADAQLYAAKSRLPNARHRRRA